MTFDAEKGMLLQGEALAILARPGVAQKVALPESVSPLPGPALLFAVRAAGPDGNVLGPQGLGLFLARSAHVGIRPALSVVFGVVGDTQTCLRLRSALGLPLETGTLSWKEEGRDRELQWAEGDFTVKLRGGHAGLPAVFMVRLAQRRADGRIMVPARITGLAKAGRALVDAGEDGPLTAFRGRHRGFGMATARLVTRPARQPVGLLSSLRAPVLGPGPVGRTAGPPPEVDVLAPTSSRGDFGHWAAEAQ